MKHSDEAIEKVLGALGEAEAPVGMERRILLAMEERAAARSRTWLRVWVPVAGVVVAMVIAGVWVGHRTVAPAPVVVARQSGASTTRPQTMEPFEMGYLEGVAEARPTHRVKQRRDEWGTQVAASDGSARPVEMSMVAPPMPLTEQERLLVEVARRGEPAKLPVLDPDGLAKREVESEARFRARFVDENDVERIGETQ